MKKNNSFKNILLIFIIMFALIFSFHIFIENESNNSCKFVKFFGLKPLQSKLVNNFNLAITIIDVEHGDCIIVRAKDSANNIHTALIDTGSPKYSKKVEMTLKDYNVKKLDFILISHPHVDHIGGLYEILNNFKSEIIYISDFDNIESRIIRNKRLNKLLKNKKINLVKVRESQKIPIGNSVFKVLYPTGLIKRKLPKDINDASIVGILGYEKFKMLFTGDASSCVEREILSKYNKNFLKSDVLKVAHHGSNTSSSLEFIKIISPQYALISSGADRNFIYPHPDVKNRFRKIGVNILNTKNDGDISIFVNSKTYEILHKK